MNFRHIIAFALATPFLATSLVSGGFTSAALAGDRECKKQIIVRSGGEKNTPFFARHSARDEWVLKVQDKLGKKWSSWSAAADAKFDCREVPGGKYVCQAQAKPCKRTIVINGPRKACAFYQINGTGKPSKLKEWAKHNARVVWSERVEEFYGKKFDTWLLANNRDYSCKDTKAGYVCTAMAKPCKFTF